MTVLIQDLQGHPPEVDDALLWVDQFSIPWTVVVDREQTWTELYLSQVSDPLTVWLIGRDGVVLYREVGETYTSTDRTQEAVATVLAAEPF